MNRKHLLSLVPILFATWWILKRARELSRKDIAIIVALYLCSCLAQPIHLLWPIWLVFFFFQKDLLKKNLGLIISLGIVFVLMALLNTFYYKFSPVYRFYYPDKTMDLLNLPDKTLALGHYFFQLFFPYFLSFKYDLSHWSVLAGLVMFLGFGIICYKDRPSRNEIFLWGLFGILPLLVVLNDPQIISDAYLLVPAISVFFILIFLVKNSGLKKNPLWLLPLIVTWTALTANESSHWNSRLDLARVSFERRPSCLSAMNFMKVGYDLYEKSPEAIRFMEENDCLKKMMVTNSTYFSMMVFFSHYYFHADELPLSQRIERLRILSTKHLYGHLSLIGLLVKNHREEEARMEAEKMETRWKNVNTYDEYHVITAKYVHPFCTEQKISGCIAITSKLINKKDRPNL